MRGSSFREPATIAIETLRSHKLRSFLMLLGIILSVSTLILVVSLINGTNRYIADRVANMASTSVVLPWSTWAMMAMLRMATLKTGKSLQYGYRNVWTQRSIFLCYTSDRIFPRSGTGNASQEGS